MSESAGARSADGAAPEVCLLLECARRPGAMSADEVRRAVSAEPDWPYVLEWAAWHGVGSMLATTLTRNAADLLSPPLLESMNRRSRTTAVRNLFLLSHLASVLAQFESRGVRALAFKGSFLAHTFYEDPSLREFSDLDIVVRRRDVRQAAGILRELGFVARPPAGDERRPRVAEWTEYARAYDRASDGVTVDLHWHLALATFRAGISMRRLWNETRVYEIGGSPVRSFSPEATLLVLCIHGSKHGPTPWPRLKWVVDVDRTVRARPDLDWDRLRRLADSLGCRRILLTGVWLASDVLGTPVPRSITDLARKDPVSRDMVERSRRSLLHDPLDTDTAPRDIAYRLTLRERKRDRASTLLRGLVFPRREDLSLVRLPVGLGLLYVPIRVLHLVGKSLFKGQIGAPTAAHPPPTATASGSEREEWVEGPLGLSHRLLLAGRLYATWASVRWRLSRMPLPELIVRLDGTGRARRRLEPTRLGRIVHRVMNVGPFRPRCLAMSLVLFRELRRQGTAAEIVIGLPREPKDHTAHAWVEVAGRVVGPPPGRLGHAEMARYGGGVPGVSSARDD